MEKSPLSLVVPWRHVVVARAFLRALNVELRRYCVGNTAGQALASSRAQTLKAALWRATKANGVQGISLLQAAGVR